MKGPFQTLKGEYGGMSFMMQTMMPTSQQPLLQTPPNVITTKDLLYIKDAMSWLLDAMKKCSHFAGQVQDQQLKQTINQIGQMHQRHYSMLLKHCQTNNTAQMAQIQQQQPSFIQQ